jgi:hypothetical protein
VALFQATNHRCAIGLMELVINPWADGVQGWL